jgi:hypothetical protein
VLEPGERVVAAVGRPPFQPPDSDDGGASDHSISKSCSAVLRCS